MKKLLLLSIVIGCYILCNPVLAQNYQNSGQLGLPGDNLNLYGVLSLFQQSQTLEEFEQKLNAEDSKINNLDLDGDGKTDYIKVIDNLSGNAHIIVLRDILSQNESQDLAVIEVAKDANNKIQVQIIGDMALYGKDYIVEPSNGTPNPGYSPNDNTAVFSGGHNVYEYNTYYTNSNVGYGDAFIYTIGAWSIVHYIFAPDYVVYNSPYRYGYYPSYWRPWHPVYYDDYYGHWHNHRGYEYFHQTHEYRSPAAHTYYGARRSTSVAVHKRIEKGDYKGTYNRNVNDNRGDRNNRNAVVGNKRGSEGVNSNRNNNSNRVNNNARTTPNANNVNSGNNSNRVINNNTKTTPNSNNNSNRVINNNTKTTPNTNSNSNRVINNTTKATPNNNRENNSNRVINNNTKTTPGTDVRTNQNNRTTPRTEVKQNPTPNNSRPNQNINNNSRGGSSNQPANNNNRTAPRNEVKSAPSQNVRSAPTPAQNTRPAEKKVEHKESERK